MIERRSGHIVLVSSGMALTAYTGYSTYAPTKFAIRGLGECLRSEMLPHNIQIYQAYPPGFQSPGFDQENLTKPADTKAIEAGEPVHTAEDVASCIVDSVRKGEYHISCGNFGINLLTRLAVGISPRNNTLADFLLAPFLVLIGKVYTSLWDSTVLSERAKMDKAEKADKSQ
jgi:short-subunit dehydrogenase